MSGKEFRGIGRQGISTKATLNDVHLFESDESKFFSNVLEELQLDARNSANPFLCGDGNNFTRSKSTNDGENAKSAAIEKGADRKSAMTYGEKVKMLVNDVKIRNKIFELISSGHLRVSAPILRLDIVSFGKDFELDKDDLYDVFTRYGDVDDVIIKPNGRAYIVYRDIVSAIFAKKCLNDYYLTELDVKLRVSWVDQVDSQPTAVNSSYADLINYYEMVQNTGQHYGMYYNKQGEAGNNGDGAANTNKLTCRYEIQIENDRDFQVARKIIGAKGCNMKRIIEYVNNKFKVDRGQNGEIVKLRLRGRGSGFKEGPDKQESQEPLHLCVSAKSKEIYQTACQLVEELLSSIYDEFRKFCSGKGRNFNPGLTLKKIETFPPGKPNAHEAFQSEQGYQEMAAPHMPQDHYSGAQRRGYPGNVAHESQKNPSTKRNF